MSKTPLERIQSAKTRRVHKMETRITELQARIDRALELLWRFDEETGADEAQEASWISDNIDAIRAALTGGVEGGE